MDTKTAFAIMQPVHVIQGTFEIPRTPERFEPSTRLVNFRRDPRDWGVPFLAAFGLTAKAIAASQGMTEGMVRYRLTKLNRGLPAERRISAVNYRNGTSAVARMVIARVGNQVRQLVAPVVSAALSADNPHPSNGNQTTINI